ncbi:hypothetical protein [Longibacter salinarum]|uniref:hypothetical protein n=1 Tax=Longibacter salinarum TaxID=1850348 RepID=UPI0015CF79B9|nr:hypothetical protein [Longibacter salinarum]
MYSPPTRTGSPRYAWTVLFLLVTGLLIAGPVAAQHHAGMHGGSEPGSSATPTLQEPGQSVFGSIQEAIRHLEADSTTDWSQVDIDRLRRHLIDMHQVAVYVEVLEKTDIDSGLRLRVRPTTTAARASLNRVLNAHPHMLNAETGWDMSVDQQEDAFVLRTTTDDAREVEKIRALGYMGLLAYGTHHRRHHWHLVRGENPHHPPSGDDTASEPQSLNQHERNER